MYALIWFLCQLLPLVLFVGNSVQLEACIQEIKGDFKTRNGQNMGRFVLHEFVSAAVICHHRVPIFGVRQWQKLTICIHFYQLGSKHFGFCSQTPFMIFKKSDTKHFFLFSAESISSFLPSYFDVLFLTLTMFLFHSVLHFLSFVLNKVKVLNYSKLFSSSKYSH